MAHRAGLDRGDPGVGDGSCFAQGDREPVGDYAVGICRNAHELQHIRASAAWKTVDQQAAERDQHWPLQARPPPSRRHFPADRTPLSHPARTNVRDHSLSPGATQSGHVGHSPYPSMPCRLPGSQWCTGGVRKPTDQWHTPA